MPKLKVYNTEGKVVGEKELDASVFGVKVRSSVVHEVLVGLRASARQPLAHTKTRGEVRGGGKKPWRQKGTGRARHGSIRSPIWTGGGITFGPRAARDYAKKINRKTKRAAFCMALSDKAAHDKLVLLESLEAKNGKTKELLAVIGKLPVKGKLAVVPAGRDELLSRSARNLKDVRLVGAGALGLEDVLKAQYLVLTVGSAEKLAAAYGKKA